MIQYWLYCCSRWRTYSREPRCALWRTGRRWDDCSLATGDGWTPTSPCVFGTYSWTSLIRTLLVQTIQYFEWTIPVPFLAHLSTKCSWWAIVVSGCPSSVVVRRASCVVRRVSTFNVYTLETTFVTWFWWNLIRMFVSTISRPSSNMGHIGSKTRSPGQILGNSCLHPRGHICDPILMKHYQNVCFDNI